MDQGLTNLAVIAFLMALLVFTEIRNYKERVALTNRLLARDLTDLASYETEVRKVKIPDKIVDPRIEL